MTAVKNSRPEATGEYRLCLKLLKKPTPGKLLIIWSIWKLHEKAYLQYFFITWYGSNLVHWENPTPKYLLIFIENNEQHIIITWVGDISSDKQKARETLKLRSEE